MHLCVLNWPWISPSSAGPSPAMHGMGFSALITENHKTYFNLLWSSSVVQLENLIIKKAYHWAVVCLAFLPSIWRGGACALHSFLVLNQVFTETSFRVQSFMWLTCMWLEDTRKLWSSNYGLNSERGRMVDYGGFFWNRTVWEVNNILYCWFWEPKKRTWHFTYVMTH